MKLRFAMFLFSILASLYSGQDGSLFDPILSYLNRYRYSIEKDDLTIENGMLSLELKARRTNYKSILLLGFHSVGRSLQKSSFPLHYVRIIIHYEMKDAQQIIAIAKMESVLALSRGQMNLDQFFNGVRY